MIRVAIIDDHYVVRVGLKTIIDMDPELQFAGEASSGEGAAAFVMTAKPDVLLLDIRMPGKDGIETLGDILAAKPSQKVVMLTTSRGACRAPSCASDSACQPTTASSVI